MTHKKIENIDFFYFKISDNSDDINLYFNLLSTDEQLKANKFCYTRDKNNYIICRGFLRTLISKYIRVPAVDICFIYNKYGKPNIAKDQNPLFLNFNLSHSGDYCLIAIVFDHDIGVDIEKHEHLEDYLEIAYSFFSKKEYAILYQSNKYNSQRLFYDIWTMKEALVKASGQGISFGLNHWRVLANSDDHFVLIEDTKFRIYKIFINTFYSAAISIVH